MNKTTMYIAVTLALAVVAVAIAGMYKFNYLAHQPDHNVDGNRLARAEYVGVSPTEAEARATADGVPFRVVMEDGQPLPVTMDYRPGRINATVVNGVVVGYEVEGMEEVMENVDVPPTE